MSSAPLPADWALSSLGEVATSIGGGTPSKSDSSFWVDGTIPWISPKDMKTFVIHDSEDHITESALGRLSVVPQNSLLVVVRSGILARTLPIALNAVPAAINQDMRAFVPAADVSARFLAWQLVARTHDVLQTCSKDGTTVASLEGPALARFPLCVAPSKEQERIVERLEELLTDLDAGVAELRAAQAKLAQYRQSLLKAAVEGALTADWRERHTPSESGAELLQHILKERRTRWEARQRAKFERQGKAPPDGWRDKYAEPVRPDITNLPSLPDGWVWTSLDALAEIQGGIQKQPSRAPVLNRYPFLRVANVIRGALRLDDVHEIELFPGELDRLALEIGDVLVVEGNGSLSEIGRCAVWDGSVANAVHQNHLIRVRPILLSGHFVAAWLNSLWGIEKMTTLAATTSGLHTLSVGKIAKIPVPVCSLAEQDQLLRSLNEGGSIATALDAALELSLRQAAAQRQNILRAAFSGRLVPQDPSDEPASALLARIRAQLAPDSARRRGDESSRRATGMAFATAK